MPDNSYYAPPPSDLDSIEQSAAQTPVSQAARYREDLGHADFTQRATHLLGSAARNALAWTLSSDEDPMASTDAVSGRFHPTMEPQIDPEEANVRYGVDGYLRFNEPTSAYDAAFLNAQAHERAWRDIVMAGSRPSPLADIGLSLAGGMIDPVGLPLMLATDGLGGGALDALGEGGFGSVLSKLGRVANPAGRLPRVLTEGAINNAPYVIANAGLNNYAGDDYQFGDALRDIAMGAALHTGVHYLASGLRALSGKAPEATPFDETGSVGSIQPETRAFYPDPVPPEGVPDAVKTLTPEGRLGALVKSIDDMADNRPVDVGDLVERENTPLASLDETTAEPQIASFRPLAQDVAVTPRGTEVPVRYGLVELGDLVTSHDDNLSPNPDFPPELQPRDRARAGAQARNYQLESELNPKLLMTDTAYGAGAPVVAPDGVVESGNGRTIALRRSAMKGGEAYGRYKAELEARGFDTSGMQHPALVRMRTEPMTGAQRASLAHEGNADVTERMSATEQAMADASRLDEATLSHLTDDSAPSWRAFARAFIGKLGGDQANSLVADDGALSKAGQARLEAALVAKAYGDPRLVEALFETGDSPIKAIGAALKDAAPAWAALRSAIARGETPAALDLTEPLVSAVELVRHARDNKLSVRDLILDRLGQSEMFGGEAISAETEAFLRLFLKDDFSRPLAQDKVAGALKDYARQAQAMTPGPDLFGAEPDVSTARQILSNLAERYARGDAGQLDIRPPGRPAEPEPGGDAARPVILDVRQPGPVGDGGGPGGTPEGQPDPGGSGGQPAQPQQPSRVRRVGRAEIEFHDAAQASVYDLGVKLSKKGEIDLGEVDAVRRSIGRYLDFSDDIPPRLAEQMRDPRPEISDKAHATWAENFDADGSPSRELMMKAAKAMAREARRDPASAALSIYDPEKAPALAGRPLEPVPIKGQPSDLTPKESPDGGKAPSPERSPGSAPGPAPDGAPEGGPGGGPGGGADRPQPPTADQIIAGDPDLKALAADTEALAAEGGVEAGPAPANQDPQTLADAIRAAAICQIGELG